MQFNKDNIPHFVAWKNNGQYVEFKTLHDVLDFMAHQDVKQWIVYKKASEAPSDMAALFAGLAQPISIEQVVRDVLARAISDGLVQKRDKRRFDAIEPQEFTASELTGVANLLLRLAQNKSGE